MNYLNLKSLPESHPLRSKPLSELNAELRNNAAPGDVWCSVSRVPAIQGKTYNQLPLSWKTYADWRIPA